jgi:hypothetical protein
MLEKESFHLSLTTAQQRLIRAKELMDTTGKVAARLLNEHLDDPNNLAKYEASEKAQSLAGNAVAEFIAASSAELAIKRKRQL